MSNASKHLVTYKFRLYPSQNQTELLNVTLLKCKRIWNELLEVKTLLYKECNFSLTRTDLQTYIKENIDTSNIHSQVAQEITFRMDKAFDSFFRRCKTKDKPGYPKFKSFVNSFTYPQSGFKIIDKHHLKLSKIGILRFVQHREIVGKVKTCTVKKVSKHNPHWYVSFSVEQTDEQFFKNVSYLNNDAVGLDIGISSIYALSDGTTVENPKFLKEMQCKLRKAQRQLSRKHVGSKRWLKQSAIVAKIQEAISNKRQDFQFKHCHFLVNKYHIIVAENVSPKFMLKNRKLSKSAADAAWNQFFNILEYEAFKYQTIFGTVDAKNTTQLCSSCGTLVPKDLSVRVHSCPHCGLVIDRDVNAAINILLRASEREGFPLPVNLLK